MNRLDTYIYLCEEKDKQILKLKEENERLWGIAGELQAKIYDLSQELVDLKYMPIHPPERYPDMHPDTKKLIDDAKELNVAIKKFLETL